MWPPGLLGGLGVCVRRPVGEEGRTDTGLVLADQPAREKEGKQNGATPIHAQVSLKLSQLIMADHILSQIYSNSNHLSLCCLVLSGSLVD